MWHLQEGSEMCTGWGKQKGNRPLGRPGHRWGIILNWIINEIRWEVLNMINLAHNREKLGAFMNGMQGISRLAEELLVSEEGLLLCEVCW